MGQAFDKDGHVLSEAYGHTKREVFDKLIDQSPDAAELRIRSRGGIGRYVNEEPYQPYPSASPSTQSAPQSTQSPSHGVTLENVERCFRYQPWGPDQVDAGDQVRESCVNLARVLLRVVPSGPDRSSALRKLRELRMDANSAITFRGEF